MTSAPARPTVTMPVREAQKLADELPNGDLVVLDGVGHCPQVEQPRRVADLISTLTAGLPAQA